MSRATDGRHATFNKFAWLRALLSDTELSDTAVRLGVVICIAFTRGNGLGWTFSLDDLAAEMGGRAFAQNTVKTAVSQLVSRGHVIETYRSRGGRGVLWRASFDLKPARADVRVLEEPARADVRVSIGNPHVHTSKPARPDVKTRTFGRTKNDPYLREDPPTGTSSGTSTGGSAREAEPATSYPSDYPDDPPEDHLRPFVEAAPATAAQPNPNPHPGPEPALRCRIHVGWEGRVPDCGACGDLRKAHDRWTAASARWRDGECDAIRAEIDACTECGPTGLTEPDDPNEPIRRCRRHRQMADLAAPIQEAPR